MKKLFYSFLFLLLFLPLVLGDESLHGLKGWTDYKIDVTKNAINHSNLGNIYFNEGNYLSALSEYKIAYNLSSTNQASASYLYNIARCYMKLNNYKSAQNALLEAINRDCINMTYYINLVKCFKELNTLASESAKYSKESENPYNKIVSALIYESLGDKNKAMSILYDFITDNPDMVITPDIKAYIRQLQKK